MERYITEVWAQYQHQRHTTSAIMGHQTIKVCWAYLMARFTINHPMLSTHANKPNRIRSGLFYFTKEILFNFIYIII